MLDAIAAFSPSGLLLFSSSFTPSLPPSSLTTLINTLISKHILEARGGTTMTVAPHVLHYSQSPVLTVVSVTAESLLSKVPYGQRVCDSLCKKLSKEDFEEREGWSAIVEKVIRTEEGAARELQVRFPQYFECNV